MKRLCLMIWLVALITVLMNTGAHAYSYADYDWKTYNGHQYALTLDFGTWQQAETEAVAIGAHLVTINDAAEELWVVENFLLPEPEYTQFWIGLYQPPGSPEPDAGWVWITGEPANYINWAYPEPTNAPPSEDYATIQGGEGWYRGGWNDWGPEREGFVPSRGVIELSEQPPYSWQVIYQTDFSVDPGWTTDQPTKYYWDAASQTYHIQPEHHYPGYQPSRYAYTLLPEAIEGSFELRWDIKPTRCDWSIGIYFGIRDENLRLGSHDIQAVFGNPDGGHMYGAAANGACGPAWQDTYVGWAVQWYSCKLTYDAGTQMMTFDIRDQGSASSIWTCTMPVPCGLTNDLKYLGTSSGGIGDNGTYPGINPWAVAEAYIDNVVLSVPAVGPVIPPIADAGDDIVADANEEVTLDGSGSSDQDGQIIKYAWKRLPDGVVIYSGPEPTCQTRALGRVEEVIELTVTDNSLATATDTLRIISRTTQQLKDQLAALQSQIEQLQQQQQDTRSLVDRICSYPPVKWWLRRVAKLGDLNGDGQVNMADFALFTKDWLH